MYGVHENPYSSSSNVFLEGGGTAENLSKFVRGRESALAIPAWGVGGLAYLGGPAFSLGR